MTWTTKLTKPVLWAVSFVLSMTLYLFVQSQTPNGTAKVTLAIMAKNLDPKLVLDSEGGTVDFNVEGPQDKIDRLINHLKGDSKYLTATVDLRAVTKPSNFYAGLIIDPPSRRDDLTFTEINRFKAEVERRKEVVAPIRVQFPPSTGPGFDPGDFETVPPSVTLQGPETAVNAAEPTVIVDPAEIERVGIKDDIALKVLDTTHHASLNSLLANPNMTVLVRSLRRERAVYVNVSFVGHLPSGCRISNYYVLTPNGPSSTIEVRGPGGLVDKTASIDASVDVSALSKSYTFTVLHPKMPDKVEFVDGPLRIHVDVEKTAK